jgi:hypothetical protein
LEALLYPRAVVADQTLPDFTAAARLRSVKGYLLDLQKENKMLKVAFFY